MSDAQPPSPPSACCPDPDGMSVRLDRQEVLFDVLRLSLLDADLDDLLGSALERITRVRSLQLEARGAIFLAAKRQLRMVVQRGLCPEIMTACASVSFGECHCGRAAEERALVFSDHVDDDHTISYPGMTPHGHYCVPLLLQDEVLGVLNIYVSEGHPFDPEEERFLQAVAGLLAGIIHRRQIEDDLARSNTELEQFAYAVSHDMRQPLRSITGYLGLLEHSLGEGMTPQQHEYLQHAQDGARRMDGMITGLLEYSRVGRRSDPFRSQPTRPLVDEAVEFLWGAREASGGEVRIVGEWPEAIVSRDELVRLFQNLIGNALKYVADGASPCVEVESRVVEGEWWVEVRDNGIGIDPEQSHRLFAIFSRLQGPAEYEGNGVGLALCRRIIEHHGGTIEAESAGEGCGATFRFCLPLGSASEPAA